MHKLIVSAIAATIGLCAFSRTFEVTLWKGETAAFRIPDYCECGARPQGISMRFGVLKSVKYAPAPHSMQRVECYDRVKWDGDDDDGEPRVVEISVPANAKVGNYDSGMMRVKVIDRVLPPARDWKYYLDLWQHPWAVSRIAKAKPFSKKHYEAMRPVWELLASAGQKTITISLLEQPWNHQCFDAYHSMFEDGDFKLFDEYVEFALSCGLGPDIGCYSLCPWKDAKLDELEQRWGTFLERFAAHLKTKGWYEHTIMAMDEREPKAVKAIYDFVQKHAPGMRISMASNRMPSDFTSIKIDVFTQIMRPWEITPAFLAEAKSRRAEGLITCGYVCCSPQHPNTFMSSGAGEAFWLGVAPAMLGLDGFLRWAWNSWPKNPKEDATYWEWRSGDTFLCYPDGEPSWRFLELRNGIIAAEKTWLLRERGLFTAELDTIAKRFDMKSAHDATCDFVELELDVQKLVNRE